MRLTVQRWLALSLLLVIIAGLLAACGGGDDDDGDPASPTSAGVSATTAGSNPTSAASAEATDDASGEATGTQAAPGGSTVPASGDATATTASGSDATATTGEAFPTAPPVTPQPTVASSVTPGDGSFGLGWNVALRGDDNGAEHNAQTSAAVVDSGFGWVRFQLEWRNFERLPNQWDPLPMDRKIDEMNAAGLNVLVSVAKAPDWVLDVGGDSFLRDYAEFEELMAFVANRYRGKVQAWEIWNEQNLAHEMNGHVQVEDYYNLLQAGATGVRSMDGEALVVFGGLTPNGVNDPSIAIDDEQYLRLIFQYRQGSIRDYYDVMGVHANSTANAPDTMYPDNVGDSEGWNDHPSFFYRRVEQLRQVMLQAGDEAKPIWITEFGWTTENQAPGYEYGANNTEAEVAEYLVRAIEIARTEWDYVTAVFVWNLNWSTLTDPSDEKAPWSALNADGSPRPAYDALQAMEK